MSSIYIHIPFCKKACHYCDFHFSTTATYQDRMVDALLKELELTQNILNGKNIETIYFGGGTPSILKPGQLKRLLHKVHSLYEVNRKAEITLECNPDDLNLQKLQQFKEIGINRLSIGIQSFHDADLKFMNRAHTSGEAEKAILMAQSLGFENITIDLIYGVPTSSNQLWKENIKKAIQLNIPHISAYCLTVEENTALGKNIKKGNIQSIPEEIGCDQFDILIQETKKAGFEQYELSNFCLTNFESKHNSNYWYGKEYLGIGPSAHSYYFNNKNQIRHWNISNNMKYMTVIEANELPYEFEILNQKDQFNEYLMTRLRTSKGIEIKQLEKMFEPKFIEHLFSKTPTYIKNGHLIQNTKYLYIPHSGKFISDQIISDLFY